MGGLARTRSWWSRDRPVHRNRAGRRVWRARGSDVMATPRCGSPTSPDPAASPEPFTGRGVRHGRASSTVATVAARFGGVSSQQRRCVCPGSYDPVTMGHVDVITRAAALYDEVVVAVLHNNRKEGTFSVVQRMKLLDLALAAVPNVRIEAFAGRLLVDVCREALSLIHISEPTRRTPISYA